MGRRTKSSAAEETAGVAVAGAVKRAKPFVKWAGGKKQLLFELEERMPESYGRYFEPMVGGGALFFHLAPRAAYLSDVNAELMNAYRVVRNALGPLIVDLREHVHSEKYYYELRAIDRTPEFAHWNNVQRASRLIYLNKTCYNGLYRVSAKGYFNTPFGEYANPRIVDEANLRACSRALKGAELEVASFEAVLGKARAGDFVYLDPPYLPLNATSNFTQYCGGGFGAEMHTKLADFCRELDRQGVHFMLSNSCTPLVEDLFRGFRLEKILAGRAINSKAAKRGRIAELIVRNY